MKPVRLLELADDLENPEARLLWKERIALIAEAAEAICKNRRDRIIFEKRIFDNVKTRRELSVDFKITPGRLGMIEMELRFRLEQRLYVTGVLDRTGVRAW